MSIPSHPHRRPKHELSRDARRAIKTRSARAKKARKAAQPPTHSKTFIARILAFFQRNAALSPSTSSALAPRNWPRNFTQ